MQAGCGLSDTGERLILGSHHDQIAAAEHLARYHWAAQMVPGKRVADVACGSGYGSQLLVEAGALSVIGIDRAADAVCYARSKYRSDQALSFAMSDATALPLADASVDVLVSFETLEHVANGERMIAEASRVLDPGGTLLISTPNPRVYPAGNPFHIFELAPPDFEDLLRRYFESVKLFYQIDWLSSSIMDDTILKRADWGQAVDGSVYKLSSAGLGHCPYVLAVCRKRTANGTTARPVTVLIRDQQDQLADVRRLRAQTEIAKRDEIIVHYQRHEDELMEHARRTGEAAQAQISRLEMANGEFAEALPRLISSNAALIAEHRDAVERGRIEVEKRDQTIAYYQSHEVELLQRIAAQEKTNGELTEAVARLTRTNAV